MAREIVSNLKFKKYQGKFDAEAFGKLYNQAYLDSKRPDGMMTKKTFSPSSFGYGNGNCPRYWYMAFNGAIFIDNNDATAIANMKNGTGAHERIQDLIKTIRTSHAQRDLPSTETIQMKFDLGTELSTNKTSDYLLLEEESEVINEYPPIRGFADLIIQWDGERVLGEIKTAKQEVWDIRQSEMKPSANHLLQLLAYMKILDIKEGFFLYENKNTQQALVIPISMNATNQEIIDGLFLWLSEVYDNFKEGDLPMRPFTKTSSQCKTCPIKKDCWSKDFGTVQIEPYEVPSL